MSSQRKHTPETKTKHHMVPGSRYTPSDHGKNGRDNVKILRWKYHRTWHELFGNMTPYEAVICIIKHWTPKKYIIHARITAKWDEATYRYRLKPASATSLPIIDQYNPNTIRRKYAWKFLFGEKDPINAIAEIVQSWAPQEYFTYILVKTRRGKENTSFSFSTGKK